MLEPLLACSLLVSFTLDGIAEVVFVFPTDALSIVAASLVLSNIWFKSDLDISFTHGKNTLPLGLLTGLTNHHF